MHYYTRIYSVEELIVLIKEFIEKYNNSNFVVEQN